MHCQTILNTTNRSMTHVTKEKKKPQGQAWVWLQTQAWAHVVPRLDMHYNKKKKVKNSSSSLGPIWTKSKLRFPSKESPIPSSNVLKACKLSFGLTFFNFATHTKKSLSWLCMSYLGMVSGTLELFPSFPSITSIIPQREWNEAQTFIYTLKTLK
jgi:hypothetical protein